MDFHFNKHEFEDGRLDFHRFVLLDHAQLQRPHPLRQRARARARARRRPRRSRRARARAGVRRFPAVAPLQRARRHDAVPVGHHQRAARAARLLRRRAPVRRYRHRPDDLVRSRRRRARRARPGVALPRVRHVAAERARVHAPKKGLRGGRPEGIGHEHRPPGGDRPPGVRRRRGPDGRRELLDRAIGIRVPSAVRRAREAWRSRRPLLARPPRAARPVRAGGHQQRRRC